MPKTLVLGGGISGLVYAFYNPCSTILGIKPSYHLKTNPFIFIQKNKYTEDLLSDLGLCPDVDYVSIYTAKTAGTVVEEKVGSRKLFEGTDRIANVGRDKKLEIYKITEGELCQRIYDCVSERFVEGEIVSITGSKVYLASGDSYGYDRIISTLPALDFDRLCSFWSVGEDIRFVEQAFRCVADPDVKGSAIFYGFDPAVAKYTKTEDNKEKIAKVVLNSLIGLVGIEYKGTESLEPCPTRGLRFFGKTPPAPERVIFSGRFATANPHWRIEDSIHLAQRGQALAEMLEEQKRLDKAIKEQNPEIGLGERLQNLILCAHSELSEVLREIPYKMHEDKDRSLRIKASNVLEEGIDVIKYVLAILHEFEYTPREIEDMFFDKSCRVWQKFLNNFFGGV